MTAHARRFGRHCREHFERPETARAPEPKPDAEAAPEPERAAAKAEPEVLAGK
ncbi:hypothetical protein [Amycolatopsis orientalis]|uniref:hypothetical protein n=1 Tax=Amycolatopsis orientalis TaxID=31958 RepID=UPI0003A653A3|nr:hypothetical protein [Amycolatopsis orientalis]